MVPAIFSGTSVFWRRILHIRGMELSAFLPILLLLSLSSTALCQTLKPILPHQCYYYRIREGTNHDINKFQIRNCSAGVVHCVKLISHHEMAGLDKDGQAETRAIEGRCAYSAYECPEEYVDRCRDEKPRRMWGMLKRERLCCFSMSLSNSHPFQIRWDLLPILIFSWFSTSSRL